MNSKTRQISEGAMMIALIGVALLLNRQTASVLEDVVYWVLSFPILLYSAKYGFKVSLIPLFAGLMLGLMFGTYKTIFYLFSALMTGILYGSGVKQGWSNKKLLSVAMIVSLVTLFVSVVLLGELFGFNVLDELQVTQDMLKQIAGKSAEGLATTVVVILYLGYGILQGLLIHLLGHQLLQRFKIILKPLKTAFEVNVPKWLGCIIVISCILYICIQFYKLPHEATLWVSLIYNIGLMIGIIDGVLSMLCVLIKKRKIKYIALVFIAVFIPFLQNIIFVFGIYDIFTGFRKRLESR